ncbi:hypothetical protein PBRA_005684 [Plasmodiophora brassicae]|uniref:Uncharacterized protein n=1 Tax=Plasmodiophora brassicae TaxID=37360 RepID=A0A0G4IPB2_PLABS|nr:hypothetical protein PBRA_005684 [Plasmodiophora brassicae]
MPTSNSVLVKNLPIRTRLCLSQSRSRWSCRRPPIARTLSRNPGPWTMSIMADVTVHARSLPPVLVMIANGSALSNAAYFLLKAQAPIGTIPPDMPLPATIMSGCRPNCSTIHIVPVLPKQVIEEAGRRQVQPGRHVDRADDNGGGFLIDGLVQGRPVPHRHTCDAAGGSGANPEPFVAEERCIAGEPVVRLLERDDLWTPGRVPRHLQRRFNRFTARVREQDAIDPVRHRLGQAFRQRRLPGRVVMV